MLIAQLSLIAQAATAGPTPTETGNAVLIFVAVGVPMISLIFGALSLWLSSRRQPPLAEELYKKFVPRAEAAETVSRIDGRMSEAFSEIGNLRNHTDAEIGAIRANMTKAYGDFERALGRIEGKLDTHRD